MRHQNAVSTIAALAMSLLAVVGSQASALSYGDLVPISELQDKFTQTGDKTYQHFVHARCAAVTFNVANVFEVSGADAQANNLKSQTVKFIGLAQENYLAKVRDPDDSDRERALETTMEEVQEFNISLGNRLEKNQRTTGDAFIQDPVVWSDMQTCVALM